jgi:glycosyltransferase involved in cell wall biosynthesis
VRNLRSKNSRLAVVLSHPTQYYSPWFQYLCATTALEIRVFYLWDFGINAKTDPEFGKPVKWDVDLLSGYESELVPNVSLNPGAGHFTGFDNPELPGRLRKWRPDALLLFGYNWASHLRCAFWARRTGVPILFRGDSTLIGREKPKVLVRAALSLLFSQFAAFLYVGAANRDYFSRFGVGGKRLFFCPHSVNADHFNRSSPTHIAEMRRLRAELHLGETTKVVLFAAKLVPGKQPMMLLSAFKRLNPKDTALVFVGDGSEKMALESAAADTPAVHFLPFANQSEMPARYLLADVFVLPSRADSWGLGVNESMHMGVPALVSDRTGCQRDLVTDGETGWVFKFDEPQSLELGLARALADCSQPNRAAEVRDAVERRIAGYTYKQTTEGLLAALESISG